MAAGYRQRMAKRAKAAKPDHLTEAIMLLVGLGWKPAGKTMKATARFGSHEVVLGERRRFLLPHTPRLVTVGKVTTCFYRVDGDLRPIDQMNVPTKDLAEVRRIAIGSERIEEVPHVRTEAGI